MEEVINHCDFGEKPEPIDCLINRQLGMCGLDDEAARVRIIDAFNEMRRDPQRLGDAIAVRRHDQVRRTKLGLILVQTAVKATAGDLDLMNLRSQLKLVQAEG